MADQGQRCDDAVQERREQWNAEREEDPARRRHRLEARELEQVLRVLDREPVANRRPPFQPEQLEQRQSRPPELAVGVDHDPRLPVRMRRDALEEREQVVDVGQEVGEDDVVEALGEPGVLACPLDEAKLRMPLARELDHPAAHVDPDSLAGLERREQVAVAAAELEDGGAGPDVRLRDGADQAVVAPRGAAHRARGELVESLGDRRVSVGELRLGRVRVRGGAAGGWHHRRGS